MASGGRFICQCYFQRNIFLEEYKLHVTFINEKQFEQDYLKVWNNSLILYIYLLQTKSKMTHIRISVRWVKTDETNQKVYMDNIYNASESINFFFSQELVSQGLNRKDFAKVIKEVDCLTVLIWQLLFNFRRTDYFIS